MKKQKYGNKKVKRDGMIFDSQREADRWTYLCQLMDAGIITELDRQVTFELLPAQYEKIVSVLDSYRDAHWALGYKNKSDVRWYCYDGNQWYGFDIDGNSMEVNQTVLKQALNMPVQTSIKRNRNGMPNQRLGIEEASVFMISHSNSD